MGMVKTQNGWTGDDRVKRPIQDDPPRVMRGGGGDMGFNNLGQPYATNAIGSGPEVTARGSNRIRRGMSIQGNRERKPDTYYDRLQARR
jgi:hypothetical protein